GRVGWAGSHDHRVRAGRVGDRCRRQSLPGRDERAVVRERGVRARRARRGGRGAAQAARVLPAHAVPPAGDRAGRAPQRPAGRRPDGAVLQLGVGSQRGGVQARPPVPRPARGPRALQDHRPLPRLPRLHDGGPVGDGPGPAPLQVRAARAGLPARPPAGHLPQAGRGVRGGLRPADGPRARAGHPLRAAGDGRRGDHGAAHHGRRDHRPAGLLPAGGRGGLRAPRGPAHRGRGHLRLRAHGPLVRPRALRRPAGHRDDGQGHHERLPAARGHGRLEHAPGRLRPRRQPRPPAPHQHLRRPSRRLRGGAREPRPHGARGPGRALRPARRHAAGEAPRGPRRPPRRRQHPRPRPARRRGDRRGPRHEGARRRAGHEDRRRVQGPRPDRRAQRRDGRRPGQRAGPLPTPEPHGRRLGLHRGQPGRRDRRGERGM
ncbi:MAG: Probable aminotransferase YhxA (B. subtilis), partial [uncultured Solirubrobacteraceae bacterium]